MRTRAGIAKVLGLVVCMVWQVWPPSFYKGLQLKPFFNHHLLEYQNSQQHHQPQNADHKDQQRWLHLFHDYYLLGLVACSSGSTSERVPCKATLLKSSSIQSFCVAIFMERNPSQWKLGWNIELLALAYCTYVESWRLIGVSYYLQAYVLEEKGPVFQSHVAAAKSHRHNGRFCLPILLIRGAHSFGKCFGWDLVAMRLYSVMWGKKQRTKKKAWKIVGGGAGVAAACQFNLKRNVLQKRQRWP